MTRVYKPAHRWLFGALLVIITLPLVQANEAIKLESHILTLVDGLSFGINGHKIKITLQLRKEVLDMLLGTKNKTGERVGLYTYQGKLYSVVELAALEQKLEEHYATKNPDEDATAASIREQEYTHLHKQLGQLLEQVKLDFDTKIEKFMVHAVGMKTPIFILIQESCEKRNLNNSLLLSWAEAREEEDRQVFHERVISFTLLSEFLHDLACFCTDLVHSCPKAQEQFKELMRQNSSNKNT